MTYFLNNLPKDFDKFFVGFDDQFNRLSKIHDDLTKAIPNYPPYNIKKTGDNTYVIELAVAGFGKQDLEVEIKDNSLVISGKVQQESLLYIECAKVNQENLWKRTIKRSKS
jgi:HSP20 family molecular chaperone IbpA